MILDLDERIRCFSDLRHMASIRLLHLVQTFFLFVALKNDYMLIFLSYFCSYCDCRMTEAMPSPYGYFGHYVGRFTESSEITCQYENFKRAAEVKRQSNPIAIFKKSPVRLPMSYTATSQHPKHSSLCFSKRTIIQNHKLNRIPRLLNSSPAEIKSQTGMQRGISPSIIKFHAPHTPGADIFFNCSSGLFP